MNPDLALHEVPRRISGAPEPRARTAGRPLTDRGAQGGLVVGDSVCVLPPVCNVECVHGMDCTPLLQ